MAYDVKWEPISEPYVYGYCARLGAYRVEVIRHYSADWRVYHYRGDQMQRGNTAPQNTHYAHASTAKRNARIWLIEQSSEVK